MSLSIERTSTLVRRLHRRGDWRKKHHQEKAKHQRHACVAMISPVTRERLYAEAAGREAFAGKSLDDIKASLDPKIDDYLSTQPWWFGGLPIDQPKQPATPAQLAALESARLAKTLLKQEVATREARVAERVNAQLAER